MIAFAQMDSMYCVVIATIFLSSALTVGRFCLTVAVSHATNVVI